MQYQGTVSLETCVLALLCWYLNNHLASETNMKKLVVKKVLANSYKSFINSSPPLRKDFISIPNFYHLKDTIYEY